MERLQTISLQLVAHPSIVCMAIAAVLWLAARSRFRFELPQVLWTAGALAALAIYLAIVVRYALDEHFFDHAEPTITAIAWLFTLDKPLYHSIDGVERYAHIYGPWTFLPHAFALWTLGPSVAVSKAVGGLAAVASLALTWRAIRTWVDVRRAIQLTGSCVLVYLCFRNYTFWTRSEPLQLLCIAASLAIVSRSRGAGAAGALGVLSGLLWNLKITGPLYTAPLVVLLLHERRWRLLAIAGIAAVVTYAAPFVLFSSISFESYVGWLRISTGNGLEAALWRRNVEWMAVLLVPVLAAVPPRAHADGGDALPAGAVLPALAACMALMTVAAAKPGAGPYHLVPFVPLLAWIVAVRDGPQAHRPSPLARHTATAAVATTCVIAIVQQTSFAALMAERATTREVADLRAFVAAHPGVRAEMGYSGSDRLTYARPELVFRSGLYLLDAPAVQEHQLAGIGIPAATIDALSRCRADAWLFPAGAEPFDGRNRYPALQGAALFPDALKEAFRGSYVKSGRTRYFDVWTCRGRPASSGP